MIEKIKFFLHCLNLSKEQLGKSYCSYHCFQMEYIKYSAPYSKTNPKYYNVSNSVGFILLFNKNLTVTYLERIYD